ncbi:hypothetical protein [Sphingopyxis sp. DBS4]|jgi:hypothetical protein|uniref:hypothetical protein n=1 Tax=Sphingopyxis sp. DBS4 TaxID=2968500 RepID=UPI00214CB763|nr:hypothetical protein [Sphingopyxis sp. DBS4]
MPASFADIIIPIGASLTGAIAAAYPSFLAGRSIQTHEWRLALIRDRIQERRQLYAKFLVEADRNVLTVVGGQKSLDNVSSLFALLAEISLVSSESVHQCARAVGNIGLSANAADEDDRGDHFAAKAAFVEAARNEIAMLEAEAYKKRRNR